MVQRHQDERKELAEALDTRWQAETKLRAARLAKGFTGIWHRLTGRYGRTKAQNEREALDALRPDRAEQDALVFRQLGERQTLQQDVRAQRQAMEGELLRLREDVAQYQSSGGDDPEHRPRRERDEERESRKRERSARPRRRRGFEP